MRYPGEPHVATGGIWVHSSAVSILECLHETGHRVTLDDDRVIVEPLEDLHEDTVLLLDALSEHLAILLSVGGATVH